MAKEPKGLSTLLKGISKVATNPWLAALQVLLSSKPTNVGEQEWLDEQRHELEKWYRGTSNPSELKGKYKLPTEGTLGGGGVYLTPNPEYASRYAIEDVLGEEKVGGFVTPFKLDAFDNPLIVQLSEKGESPEIKTLELLGLSPDKAVAIAEKAWEERGGLTTEVKRRAIALGYDGIILVRGGKVQEAITYKPEKLKSIFQKKGGGSVLMRNPYDYPPRAI